MRGRVGDSPIIGAGLYVDNEIGAATATGTGEEVIRIAGTHLVVELMRNGKSPYEACKAAVERMIKIRKEKTKDFQVGFIAVSYTHLRAHETVLDLVCRLLLEKKKQQLLYKLYSF